MSSEREHHDSLKALELCQRELAQVRAAQEPLEEILASTRDQLAQAEQQIANLTRVVNDELLVLPTSRSVPDRGYRWLRRRKLARNQEWRVAQELKGSDLFDGPWYFATYPDAVRSGLPAALHYVRHGAAAGNDPGPNFSTSTYLETHPKAAASGMNPLQHYLQGRKRPSARGTS